MMSATMAFELVLKVPRNSAEEEIRHRGYAKITCATHMQGFAAR